MHALHWSALGVLYAIIGDVVFIRALWLCMLLIPVSYAFIHVKHSYAMSDGSKFILKTFYIFGVEKLSLHAHMLAT